jgi:hypothetical protein
MDFNGNDLSGGAGVPDPLNLVSICAEDGTFQNLNVGPCGAPLYEMPRIAKGAQPRAVIVDESAQTVNISEIQRVMQAFYVAIDSFTIPVAGQYTIDELVQLVQDGFNAKYAAETNVLTMWVGNDGHVNARITEGSQPSFRMVETGGLLQMGNTVDSGAIPPNNTYRFPSLPNFSGTVMQSGWRGYNFDDSGYIFEGDMRITGALEVATIVSDLEVEDSLVFINKNQPSDSFSSGLVINTFNNTRFSGLVKADSSNDFHLFASSATIPTASGWTPVSNANLFIGSAHINNPAGLATLSVLSRDLTQPVLSVDTPAGQTAFLQEWRTNGLVQASLTNGGRFDANVLDALTVGCTNFTVGQPGTTYTLPTGRGTDGQILITDAVGGVTWADNPGLLPGDKIVSPDALNEVVASNITILAKHNGTNRLFIDATSTDVLSGDTSYVVSTSNSRVLVSDATGGRLELSNAETLLKSPDKDTSLTILNDDAYIDVGATQPFRATPIVTTLKGGGGNDPTITLQTGTSSWVHSTRNCLTTAPSTVQVGYNAGTASYSKYEAAGVTKYHAGTIREIVDGSNTFLYSPDGINSSIRLGNTVFINRVAGVDRFKIDTAESLVKAPNSINSLGVSNIQTIVNGQFAVNGLARFEATGVELLNGVPLKLGHTSASVEKPVSIRMISNAILIKGQALKIVNVGGVARVEPVAALDPDDTTGVIGVSLSAAIVGGDVEAAVGGLFEWSVQSGITITVGDAFEKSDVEAGRIIPKAPNAKSTYGIALTTATGSLDGSVRVLCVFTKNEVL